MQIKRKKNKNKIKINKVKEERRQATEEKKK